MLFSNIKEETVIAKVKNYDSARVMSMFSDEVTPVVCDNLIDEVHNGFDSIYKYYDLKKKILGLDELHLYDIYTPIIQEGEEIYPYDEAVEIVLSALGVLGEEYVKKLREGINSRWIDVYPGKAKRTGGYSGGSYDTYPYILLNYQDRYSDMSTLAHEGGHSMHSYYTRSNNPYQYGDYTIFVAEVASTVNELILANYMLENSKSDKEKLSILGRLMELYKATIYRQTMFAEFERDIYDMVEKDVTLTSDILCSKYYELNKLYFGDSVVIDDEIRYEWERIPHFYYNFYVYKYATGLSAATKIVTDILSGKEKAVDNYLSFLKCGRTRSPLESLKVAGVDLNDKETVRSAIKYFDKIVDDFSELYDKVYNK
jgi:oligoendopeptidase F